jgi:hypothetical protein
LDETLLFQPDKSRKTSPDKSMSCMTVACGDRLSLSGNIRGVYNHPYQPFRMFPDRSLMGRGLLAEEKIGKCLTFKVAAKSVIQNPDHYI